MIVSAAIVPECRTVEIVRPNMASGNLRVHIPKNIFFWFSAKVKKKGPCRPRRHICTTQELTHMEYWTWRQWKSSCEFHELWLRHGGEYWETGGRELNKQWRGRDGTLEYERKAATLRLDVQVWRCHRCVVISILCNCHPPWRSAAEGSVALQSFFSRIHPVPVSSQRSRL